jgi:hypothetical protein
MHKTHERNFKLRQGRDNAVAKIFHPKFFVWFVYFVVEKSGYGFGCAGFGLRASALKVPVK